MTSIILPAMAGVLGLLVGSFGNVVVHRVPAGRSVIHPPSACPQCGTELRARDNVPVLSWLVLRGRCRSCGEPISARYPVVEALVGVLFAATALAHPGWELLFLLPFVWLLVVSSAIDLDLMIIPNALTYPAVPVAFSLVALVGAIQGAWPDAQRAVLAGIGLPGSMFVLSELFRLLRGKVGIGMGDVKLAVTIGLVIGYLGGWELLVFFYASTIGSVLVAVGLMLAGRAKLATRLPFGPYLAFGAVVAVLFGEPLGAAVGRALGVS